MRVEKNFDFVVSDTELKIRVDAFLSSKIPTLSRSALTGPECEIYINSSLAKKSDKVKNGDCVSLFYAADVFEKVEPQDIPLEIIYEDSDMLVINKAQGMIVHPGAGNTGGTVVNALAYKYGQEFIDSMADECDVSRPGIVHRLDKDTSGVMVVALNARSHACLSAQFQNREIKKYYYAICDGFFSKRDDDIECLLGRDKYNRKLFSVVPSGGKTSKTHFSVVKQFDGAALVKVRIFTGRTHQIRIHMKSIGHPVVGDILYNSKLSHFSGESLMLHSYSLEICHPVTGLPMVFKAPLPERFTHIGQIEENLIQ